MSANYFGKEGSSNIKAEILHMAVTGLQVTADMLCYFKMYHNFKSYLVFQFLVCVNESNIIVSRNCSGITGELHHVDILKSDSIEAEFLANQCNLFRATEVFSDRDFWGNIEYKYVSNNNLQGNEFTF